ncbi:MAG: dihydropteroate synthase [Paracoccaceae bacterium]
MTGYYRPLVQHGAARPTEAVPLAGGAFWFTQVERLGRDTAPDIVSAAELSATALERLTAPRADFAGLRMYEPQVMGILNVTPDSFSDGGRHCAPTAARQAALDMVRDGATIIDIGGESTRPGAILVDEDEEIARTATVIAQFRAATSVAVSIDTRKARVAQAALAAGADIVNDVSGFTYDVALAPLCATQGTPVCVMHSKGDPATMQNDPVYDNVLLDVYDFLETQIASLVRAGVSRDRIMVDPGIGFAKNQAHNLTILQNISLFHGLGCAILLGASRKRFIGTIGMEPRADARAPGSIAVALAALGQGVQVIRVHDVAETAQAVRLWRAVL